MKRVNCRSVCFQIDAAEAGWEPSSTITEHLLTCDNCRAFFADRAKLRQMVAGLGQVEVPPDFDFRLRARLAAEDQRPTRSFSFGGLRLRMPTAVVATLAVIVVGAFVFRSLNVQPVTTTSLRGPDLVNDSQPSNVTGPIDGRDVGLGANPSVPKQPPPRLQRRVNQVAANQKGRANSRDFSSGSAPVVKNEESVASAFAVDTSQQSLKVSLDDGTGVSRTISVPRVSFGSQRAFGEQSAFIKTSASKGDW